MHNAIPFSTPATSEPRVVRMMMVIIGASPAKFSQ